MIDWGSPREPRWSYALLDENNVPLFPLDGVKGGTLELVALSRLGGSGSLLLTDRGQEIDWMKHRVRISYDPGIPGAVAWPVATMMLSSPERRTLRSGLVVFEVGLLSRVAQVDEDATDAVYSLAAGAVVIAAVQALLRSAGVTNAAVTPSAAKLKSATAWEAGTSKLTIINDLLESIGYWSLFCNGEGVFVVAPYELPAERVVAFEFDESLASVHRPEWVRTQDLSSVPNKYVVVGEGTPEELPLVGVAKNEDPASPFSYQSRGRWIARTDEGVELTSQAEAHRLAQRRLLDAMSPVAKLDVEHAMVPVTTNQVVRFAPEGVPPVLATVQRMEFGFGFDAHVSAEWREV